MMARLDGVRVLVVEDERLVVTLLEEMLKFAGCVIVGRAKRVAQALEAVRATKVLTSPSWTSIWRENTYIPLPRRWRRGACPSCS
jgi:CheY-like chemotaxis protein